jgi:CRP/FNR family cyclic AMP-dependent transcriptional regulator
MPNIVQLAAQLQYRGAKSVSEPLSASLFDGATSRHLKANETLFVAGEPGDGCYRLEQGLLKVVVTSGRGEERILAIHGFTS